MAVGLEREIRANLLRLWRTKEFKNHELAFKLLEGFNLSEDDLLWLLEIYKEFNQEPKAYSTFRHHHHFTDKELLSGKILAVLLDNNNLIFQQEMLNSFYKDETLRIPYSTLAFIPKTILEFKPVLKHLIWQDGELLSVSKDIIHLKTLETLDLRRQPIEFIHPNLSKLEHLKELYLISTSFIPQELSEREDLDFYTDAPY